MEGLVVNVGVGQAHNGEGSRAGLVGAGQLRSVRTRSVGLLRPVWVRRVQVRRYGLIWVWAVVVGVGKSVLVEKEWAWSLRIVGQG